MSTITDNLGLFKYDTTTDSEIPFSINTALNGNWDIIDSSVNNYVKKSGDTMTGNLIMTKTNPAITMNNKSTDHSYTGIYFNSSVFDYTATVAPTESNIGLCRILGNDKNGNQVGGMSVLHNTGNRMYTSIFTNRVVNGNTINTSLRIGVNSNGTTYSYCPESDAADSIVTTKGISKATNGYVKFGNGIIIQWGHYTANGTAYETGVQVNLSVSFSNKNYMLAFGLYNPNVGRGVDFNDLGYYSKTVSSFKLLTESTTYTNGCDWIAIGY